MPKKATKKKRVRRAILTTLFVALNAAVIGITAANEFGNSETAAELSEVSINWWLLIPAVLCFAVGTFFNIYKYVVMMRAAFGAGNAPSFRKMWKTAWRVVMLGKYYDNVTPAAIGGQPFQIYYMRKNSGLPAGHATSMPMVAMVAGQIAFLILALVCFIFGGVLQENPALIVTAWVGLLFYAFWPATIFGASYFPKFTTRVLKFFVKLLAKIKIIKNRENTLKRIENEVAGYTDAVKMTLKSRGLFMKVILMAFIFQFLTSCIPYFVLKAFGGDMDFFRCLATTVAVTAAVYFVPTPGNSVAAEGTFYAVFSPLSTGYVFWAMLVWRFFSYYVYVLMGPLTYLIINIERRKNGADHNADRDFDGGRKNRG